MPPPKRLSEPSAISQLAVHTRALAGLVEQMAKEIAQTDSDAERSQRMRGLAIKAHGVALSVSRLQ